MRLHLFCGILLASCAACTLLAGLGKDYEAVPPDQGDAGDAGDAGPPASCAALLAARPAVRGHNGTYVIDPDGPGGNPAINVFCEMSLDNGGWTLVGRSAQGAGTQPFGWSSATGDISNLAQPYSLDVHGTKLAFSEVLLADCEAMSLDAATRAYKLILPATFIADYAGTTYQTHNVTTVFGDCSPPGGPEMLRYAGDTTRSDSFFFRDLADLTQKTGLKSSGFDLTYDNNCPRGGSLHRALGMILVR